jgi:hypothetical protein
MNLKTVVHYRKDAKALRSGVSRDGRLVAQLAKQGHKIYQIPLRLSAFAVHMFFSE